MTTVRELIQDAAIEAGIQDPNESMSAEMSAHALRVLNRMLDAWSTEDLMVYTEERNVYALTIGQQDYTIGVGGNFNVARPVQVTRCSAILSGQTPVVEIPIPILLTQDWQGVAVKTTTGSFPTSVYITGDYPLQKLSMWPIPSIACSIAIYSWGQLLAFSAITDTVQFPKGYADAIVYNLAVRLGNSYGRPLRPDIAGLAQQAKSRLRTINAEPIKIGSDSALTGNTSNIGVRSFGYVVD